MGEEEKEAVGGAEGGEKGDKKKKFKKLFGKKGDKGAPGDDLLTGGGPSKERKKDKKGAADPTKLLKKKDRSSPDKKAGEGSAAARPSYRIFDKKGGGDNEDGAGDEKSDGIIGNMNNVTSDMATVAGTVGGGTVAGGMTVVHGDIMSVAAGSTAKDGSTAALSPSQAQASASAIKASHIAQSAGTHRLNRILRNTSVNIENQGQARGFSGIDDKAAAPVKMERVSNPTKVPIVADFAAKVVIPPLKVDPRSIGGTTFEAYPASMQQETLLCFKCKSFESTGTEVVAFSALEYPADYAKHKRSLGLFSGIGTAKGRNKLRYVLIARSTNQPLLASRRIVRTDMKTEDEIEEEEASNNFGYDTLYSPDPAELDEGKPHSDFDSENMSNPDLSISKHNDDDQGAGKDTTKDGKNKDKDDDNGKSDGNKSGNNTEGSKSKMTDDPTMDEDEEEVSSFPALVCMTFHSDGTTPDIRKLIQLDKLTTVQDLQGSTVQLVFVNGDTVRIDFGEGDKDAVVPSMNKERFIWSLLQTHAMLCVSVVERTALGNAASETAAAQEAQEQNQTAAAAQAGTPGAANAQPAPAPETNSRGLLPPLNVRNIDRAELQYLATVNHFIRDSDTIRILLDRQRHLAEEVVGNNNTVDPTGESKINEHDVKPALEEMDSIAYDLMMGNFATRVAIFQNEAERKDAEQILNSTEWTFSLNASSEDTAAATAAERLSQVLQKRMRDLEAETCRRLIAWEDEKHYSKTVQNFDNDDDAGGKKGKNDKNKKGRKAPDRRASANDSVDALSLASLFTTLDALDKELENMENWLQERAAAIKPMTDDCQDIEEENRQLEQQWTSYDMLGAEMRRLLNGLQVGEEVEKVLNNPASALVYKVDGAIDIDASEHGVDQIHDAGKALQEAMHHVHKCGGLHLKSVRERADALEATANIFCTALAQIIVTVMEQFKTEVVAGSDYGKVSKSDTHTIIAKKIRDTQRKFQSALLGYIKLIEILAELSPELLPAVRDAYSEMVAEGIMMKKRMKGYFQALPGKNASYLNNVSKDLRDYIPFEIVTEETVHADDIRYSLSELLPVIAREAYFTAALFGLSSKAQDGREKKRNFEAAKKSVDHSSQYFNYYIQRTCGIIQDFEPENPATNPLVHSGLNQISNQGDPMLCLVASIHLNEAMANYIDREKKGGDHSLSLAYVRATILELRKKVDKQWVAWVDKQIEWIRSHPGVPANGKRAGIIPSFARFPCYLDHILLCCREGRRADADYEPDLANIKVVSYYLQKVATALLESLRECSERETTDQQYASNVMQMENTYYFTQTIKQRGTGMSNLFKKQIAKANTVCKQSTDSYLGWMIKREFTSLHELFSKISRTRREHGDRNVNTHVPKTVFVRTLLKESSRDVLKEKIGILHTRMGKHLSEKGGLLPVAWKALVKVLYEWFGRWEKLAIQCYNHKLDPSAVDVVRIAKAAGSTSSRKTAEAAANAAASSGAATGNGDGMDEPGVIIPGSGGGTGAGVSDGND